MNKSKRNSEIVKILKNSFDSKKDTIIMVNDTIIIKRSVYICNVNIISNSMKIFINGNLILDEFFSSEFDSAHDFENLLSNSETSEELEEELELCIHDLGNIISAIWEKIIS